MPRPAQFAPQCPQHEHPVASSQTRHLHNTFGSHHTTRSMRAPSHPFHHPALHTDLWCLQVLVLPTTESPSDGPIQDLPSEEVFFRLIELDSADAPAAVRRDSLAPERFHNQYAPIPAATEAAPPKSHRRPGTGPFLSTAVFPPEFPVAVAASSLLQELHFVHLMRRVDEDDADSGMQWWAISNSMDELQVQLPGARQDGQLVPNYVVGAAAFACRPGVSVLHPTDGIEPAEVRHGPLAACYAHAVGSAPTCGGARRTTCKRHVRLQPLNSATHAAWAQQRHVLCLGRACDSYEWAIAV